jgi:hypothetical protein
LRVDKRPLRTLHGHCFNTTGGKHGVGAVYIRCIPSQMAREAWARC